MKLLTITGASHVFNGRTSGTPLRLLLTFDDGRRLRLGVAEGGGAMEMDDLGLDAQFDAKRFGKVAVEDLTQVLDEGLAGAEVGDIRLILLRGTRIGVQLGLGDGETFSLWVDGDELWWGDAHAFSTHIWPDGLEPRIGAPVEV